MDIYSVAADTQDLDQAAILIAERLIASGVVLVSGQSLTELVKLAFGRDDLDGRSKQGKAVKQFLAARQIKPRKSHEYQAKGLIELTEDQKEYISNNCATMTGIEIAKIY